MTFGGGKHTGKYSTDPWIGATLDGVRLAAATVAMLALAGCGDGHTYDEQAHRAAVVDILGREPADWPTLRELALDACGLDDDQLELQAAISADAEDPDLLAVFLLGVEYACPERLDDVPPRLRS